MIPLLVRALGALVPVRLLIAGSAVLLLRRRRTVWVGLQMLGAACLSIVVLAQLFGLTPAPVPM